MWSPQDPFRKAKGPLDFLPCTLFQQPSRATLSSEPQWDLSSMYLTPRIYHIQIRLTLMRETRGHPPTIEMPPGAYSLASSGLLPVLDTGEAHLFYLC